MSWNRHIVVWVLVVVLLSGGRVSQGQEPADPVIEAINSRVTQFLEGVSMGQAQTAYQEFLAGSQLLKQTEALKALVDKTNQLETKYGRYQAFEQVAAKRVGADLVLLRYLYKCENFPVVWYFTFYRTPKRGDPPPEDNNNWRVISVRFDTRLELLGL